MGGGGRGNKRGECELRHLLHTFTTIIIAVIIAIIIINSLLSV